MSPDTQAPTVLRFSIPDVPDPQDRSLVAACGGDVSGKAAEAASQFLRAFATLPAGEVSCVVRFSFDPARRGQARLRTNLLLKHPPGSALAAVLDTLVQAGPLEPIFGPKRTSPAAEDRPHSDDAADYGAVCEIVKRELIWTQDHDRRQLNPDIPDHYYLLTPFQARPDNDWSALDRLLDRFQAPAMVEVALTPADVRSEREVHYRLVTALMRVNQTGWDLDPEKARMAAQGVELHEIKVRDPVADELLREHEDLQRALREPQFHFSVRCFAGSMEEARLLGSTVAEAALGEGKYRLLDAQADDEDSWVAVRSSSDNLCPTEGFDAPDVWQTPGLRPGMLKLRRLARLAQPSEIEGFFRLPVSRPGAPPRTARGRRDPRPLKAKELRKNIIIGDDLELGRLEPRLFAEGDSLALEKMFSGGRSGFPELRLTTGMLRKHIFIAGVPGSGKTTAMFNILCQLAHLDEPIPFLVIEPAKTEYRTLKRLRVHPDPEVRKLAEGLRVYTVGSEAGSPFRFNPLAYPEGISLDEHIGAVLSCFEAAMPMGGPLQGLLAEAVEEVYANPPEGQRFPRLKDLLRTARTIVDRKGYEGEVLGNLKAALDVRLGLLVRRSLGRVFDCDEGVPSLDELFTSNVVLEMDYLTSEHACLMSLFVLASLREHIRVTRASGAALTHVTVLEEAHNIVGRAGEARASEEAADPKAFAAQYVSRMLAELRALGEGIVIADQLPSAVAPEVVKNTGTKLAHRLVANQDREDLGGTMLLDGAGMEELARLQPGEAYFYSESTFRPRRCRGLPTHLYLGMGQPAEGADPPEMPQPPGRELFESLVKDEVWFREDCAARVHQMRREVDRAGDNLESLCQEIRERVEAWQQDLRLQPTIGVKGTELETYYGEMGELYDRSKAARSEAGALLVRLWDSADLDVLGSPGFDAVGETRKRLAERLLPEAEALSSALWAERRLIKSLMNAA